MVYFIHRPHLAYDMAKTDSFFIRATAAFDGINFVQESIDLGAYVDALGKSVLRIHNVAVKYGSAIQVPDTTTNAGAVGYQLTTQSQSALVSLDDKSVIASGTYTYSTDAAGNQLYSSDAQDLSPQSWRNGYLIGVEQIYLGIDQALATSFTRLSVVLECTVETLSQSAAMALALSQQ